MWNWFKGIFQRPEGAIVLRDQPTERLAQGLVLPARLVDPDSPKNKPYWDALRAPSPAQLDEYTHKIQDPNILPDLVQPHHTEEQKDLLTFFVDRLSTSPRAMNALKQMCFSLCPVKIIFDENQDYAGGIIVSGDNNSDLGVVAESILLSTYGFNNDISSPNIREELLKIFLHEVGHFMDESLRNKHFSVSRLSSSRIIAEANADQFYFAVAMELPVEMRRSLLNNRDLGQHFQHFCQTNPAIAGQSDAKKQELFLQALPSLWGQKLRHTISIPGYNVGIITGLSEKGVPVKGWLASDVMPHADGIDINQALELLESGQLLENGQKKATYGLSMEAMAFMLHKVKIEEGTPAIPVPGAGFLPGTSFSGNQIFYPLRRLAAGRTLAQIALAAKQANAPPEIHELLTIMDDYKKDYQNSFRVKLYMEAIVDIASKHSEAIKQYSDLQNRVIAMIGKKHPMIHDLTLNS